MSVRPDNEAEETVDPNYLDALVEAAFPTSVWIGERAYNSEGLRQALKGSDFRQQVAAQYRCDSEKSSDEDLVKKVFPVKVRIGFRSYDRTKLSTALEKDRNLRRRVAEKFASRLDSKEFVERVFAQKSTSGAPRTTLKIGNRSYDSGDLYPAMARDPTLRRNVAALIASERYCYRLAEIAFPATVWIEGLPYKEEELRKALASGESKEPVIRAVAVATESTSGGDSKASRRDSREAWDQQLAEMSKAGFEQRVRRKYGLKQTSTIDNLIHKIFPGTVTIDGSKFDSVALYNALLDSHELQDTFARKYHLATNEYYWSRLAQAAFCDKGKVDRQSVRISSIIYDSAEELYKELAQGDSDFCRQVENACRYTRSEWLRDLYCQRLVEEVFPETVQLHGRTYNEMELRAALEGDKELREELAERYQWDARTRENVVEKLMDNIFPKSINIWDKDHAKGDLKDSLSDDPRLQQHLAARTNYVPSKWLLEQEMQASGVWNGDLTAGDIYNIASERRLTGVCFSGGGIRSATFNLGVLQGLAQLDLLPHIDYLSTVSGGGYIHEFLIGWILRNGSRSSVAAELIPQAEPGCLPRAPEPIQWLKRYSSYLTPVRGIFSPDTWTALAIWLRNTILNQIPILAAFAFGLFLLHLLSPRPLEGWQIAGWGDTAGMSSMWLFTGLCFLLYALISVFKLGRNLIRQERRAASGSVSEPILLTNLDVVGWIIVPWLACSVWISFWVQMHPRSVTSQLWFVLAIPCLLVLAIVELVIFAGGAPKAYKSLNPSAGWWRNKWAMLGFLIAGGLAATVAVALGWALTEATQAASETLAKWIHACLAAANAVNEVRSFSIGQVSSQATANLTVSVSTMKDGVSGFAIDSWRIRLAILPPLLLSIPYAAIELTLGLLGRDYGNMRREWLARLRAWSLLYALLWTGLVSLTFLGPYVGYYIAEKGTAWIWSTVVLFFTSHLATILAGWSGNADGKPTNKGILGFKPMDLLALVAAPVAIATLLLALSFGASVTVDKLAEWMALCPVEFVQQLDPYIFADLLCLTATLLVAVLLGLRVDINAFSMHSFYRNRLSRCYLGATVPGKRMADPFTGFDDRSQVKAADGNKRPIPPRVSDLLPSGYRKAAGQEGTYDGPFPIFCTTLNLTTGQDLATQERKGTSFAFTPLYSGYSVSWTDGGPNSRVSYNGYVPTDKYAYPDDGIHLDSAVAISGAALNPNQGYNSNSALAFLMTFFNVRLGWWISNTRNMDAWPASSGRSTPLVAIYHLLKELFGTVGDAAKYVNLSDGGHFENMGLYELVRRRCHYIVVCDAEADPEMKFEGMGAAITKCRADFGAEIDLDLRPLQIQQDTGCSKAHCVVGTIRYPPPPRQSTAAQKATLCGCFGERRNDDFTGVIVYMKSSLVGDEPADLLTHKLKCATFPQDPTANQWFTETLFEAYRRLGHHVAMTTIRPALPPKETLIKGRKDLPELFDRMYSIWYPRTPEMEKYLTDHLQQYEGILKELRERKELTGLERALNGAKKTNRVHDSAQFDSSSKPASLSTVKWTAPAKTPGSAMYAVQFAISLLNFMYTVYTDLQLAFPDNRVSPHAEWWICLFRRWCRVDLVRETWDARTQIFSEEFRLFARRELNLP